MLGNMLKAMVGYKVVRHVMNSRRRTRTAVVTPPPPTSPFPHI